MIAEQDDIAGGHALGAQVEVPVVGVARGAGDVGDEDVVLDADDDRGVLRAGVALGRGGEVGPVGGLRDTRRGQEREEEADKGERAWHVVDPWR